MLPAPRHALAVADREQQLELLGEQLVVVAQVVTEEWERLDERSASRHDLGASAGDQVEVGELLKDPHRILGGENGHGAREPDLSRQRGNRGQRRRRRGDQVVGTMVLAEGEELQAEVVGELRLFEEIAHPLLRADARVQVGKRDKTEIHQRIRTTIAHSSIPAASSYGSGLRDREMTVAPPPAPATAAWSAVCASESGNALATSSESSPSASARTSAASRAPSAWM